MTKNEKTRVLVFIVAYYAEKTILEVLRRIPPLEDFDVEVLIVDDGSTDATFALSERLRRSGAYGHRLTVLANPVNQGYGGNQKIGYHYALRNGFDIVALVHGDGQYAPEMLPELLAPIVRGDADFVHGSRLIRPRDALRGGMPLYKFAGNRLLTRYQNWILGASLSEYHTGYKVYSAAALRRIPFELNSNVFHFDTEIIIQLLRARCRLVEVPIPTHYGDEVCRVNGLRYALDVIRASTAAWLQKYLLVYRRNFDVESYAGIEPAWLASRLDFESTHSEAVKDVGESASVLDLGCGRGDLCAPLRAKGCRIVGVDRRPADEPRRFDAFHQADIERDGIPCSLREVDTVLLIDVLEHLSSPETFCTKLREVAQQNLSVRIVLSAGNVGFFVTRLMLLLGQFNYTKRGILDLTHTRLFTFSSLRRLLRESGFLVEKEKGLPAPVPLVVSNPFWRRFLMRAQSLCIRLSRGLFSYQMYFVVRPLPTLPTLLDASHEHSLAKAAAREHGNAS